MAESCHAASCNGIRTAIGRGPWHAWQCAWLLRDGILITSLPRAIVRPISPMSKRWRREMTINLSSAAYTFTPCQREVHYDCKSRTLFTRAQRLCSALHIGVCLLHTPNYFQAALHVGSLILVMRDILKLILLSGLDCQLVMIRNMFYIIDCAGKTLCTP